MSSNLMISIEHISKKYLLGKKHSSTLSFREVVTEKLRHPLQALKPIFSTKEQSIWALQDVSFRIDEGDAVALIGPNGSGKSTLLKILSKITPPTSGQIYFRGKITSLLEIGCGFHPELTGRENIFLYGAIMGMKKKEIEKLFDSIVYFSDIELFLDTPIKRYSSGMQMRLAFSIAMHLTYDVLIVDEIMAVGDALFQEKSVNKLHEVMKSGKTLLFVSHHLEMLRTLCKKGVLLVNGQVVTEGPIQQVIDSYLQVNKENPPIRNFQKENAPTNGCVTLQQVRLVDESGELLKQVHLSTPFFVEISFEVIKATQANFMIDFFNSDNHLIFHTLSNQENPFYGKKLKEGHYVAKSKIPGHLLNCGTFSINVNLLKEGWSDNVSIEKTLSFQAIDDGVLRSDFLGDFNGSFRPFCKWEVLSR